MPESEFATWAIVEVMGHKSYSGFVTAETIAGAAMLRIDVPAVGKLAGFTKYLSMQAIYGISPCTEETARRRAEATKATPFESWSVEQQMMADLKKRGLLLEHSQIEGPEDDDDMQDHEVDEDEDDRPPYISDD
jgi:hypothetical protein